MKLVGALIAIAGCGSVAAPADPPPRTPAGVVEIAPPEHASEATAIIEHVFDLDTGAALVDVDVEVHWTAALIPCGDIECGGLSYGCGSIWVAAPPRAAGDPPTGIPMALAHELGHCARGVLTGDSDGAHADAAWWSDDGYVHRAILAVRTAGF